MIDETYKFIATLYRDGRMEVDPHDKTCQAGACTARCLFRQWGMSGHASGYKES